MWWYRVMDDGMRLQEMYEGSDRIVLNEMRCDEMI
jgi:hypothetical protein